MLAGILPGVRELRAPLAAGYLWLLILWIAFGDALPTKDEVEPGGPVERFYDLEPVVSSLGLAVVASVAAYIIGSIAVEAQGYIGSLIRDLGPEGETMGGSRRDVAKTRLLDLSEPLHAEVDRPDSEATFRMALWPPILVLVIYAGFEFDTWWFIALLVPVALIWQWLMFRVRAERALGVAAEARPEILAPAPEPPSSRSR